MKSKITSRRGRLDALVGWRPGHLAKGAFALTAGTSLRALMQACVFLIVARVLGIDGYGSYAAVLALAGALGCLGGLGSDVMLVRDVSRRLRGFGHAWSRGLALTAIGAPVLFTVYLLLAWSILPARTPLGAIWFIGIAELVFAPFSRMAMAAYQAHERMGRASQLVLIPVLTRLISALILLFLSSRSSEAAYVDTWAGLYAVAGLISAVYSGWLVRRDLGIADVPSASVLARGLREGFVYASGTAAQRLYADIDKAMLARLATVEAAGAYSAAYRLADLTAIPIRSLLAAALPRFFRAGERGSLEYAVRILPIPFIYALAISGTLFYLSGLLPLLLGSAYASAVPVLQWLAWLPAASLPRLFLQSLLVGAGRQQWVVTATGAGAVANITMNLWMIPAWGWVGAVAATYAAELGMTLLMLMVGLRNRTR